MYGWPDRNNAGYRTQRERRSPRPNAIWGALELLGTLVSWRALGAALWWA